MLHCACANNDRRCKSRTNEEEFYQGGWVATGPNNLFYPLMTDVRLQEEFDMAFWCAGHN
eukprot:SAG31_NODE_123_length_23712_cov_41.426291_29_plen_60_part_00